MHLLVLALAPVLIILIYIYVRDKYDKEPLPLLLKSLVLGGLISIPVVFVEGALTALWQGEFTITHAGYTAFVVAGLTEELFKFIILYWLIWKHKEYDEKYDGIVYAVFISLGFAAVENVLYVLEYGAETGYLRAFTAVPAHAFFGVVMGFYFALAKFVPGKKSVNLVKALLIPILLHGVYDFILMSQHEALMLLFVPYMIWMFFFAKKKMKDIKPAKKFILPSDTFVDD